MAGMLTIIYICFLAFFVHLIAPDKTPYAGDQINELAYKKPGFSMLILELRSRKDEPQTAWWKHLLYGKPSVYHSIPITSYYLSEDSLFVTRYIGEGIDGTPVHLHIREVIPQAVPDDQIQQELKNVIHRKTFWFGTDDLGRDYLSRILLGTRVSLSVGFLAVLIALCIGIPLGAWAGFYRQRPPVISAGKTKLRLPVDGTVMWFINIIWSIPTLLLVFPIVFAFGQQFYTIFIAVGLTMWVDIARLVRGQVMQVREMEFVQATRTFGFSDARAIWRHILPNILGPVIVITAANFAYAILTEAGLSFLGIGVQPPAPSWGLMIAKYKDNLITEPWLALIPGTAITLVVLAFFMVGNGLRDAFDMRSRW